MTKLSLTERINGRKRPYIGGGSLVGATRAAASVIGVAAGLLAVYHGYNETLQGSSAPSSIFINAVGPPCQGSACFPAMTVIPDFFVAGVVTIIVALVVLLWSAAFVQKKNGWLVLIILSIILLLVGGGFGAPVLGFIAGAIGTRIRHS
jgi:hypothetical protein